MTILDTSKPATRNEDINSLMLQPAYADPRHPQHAAVKDVVAEWFKAYFDGKVGGVRKPNPVVITTGRK